MYYPGLATHPGHDLAHRQQSGYGSLFSFELKGGRAAADEFLARLRLFTLAESLGGVESLICHPATMTHAAMDEAAQAIAGIGKGLLRVSVGIESADDLVADLKQALSACRVAATGRWAAAGWCRLHPGRRAREGQHLRVLHAQFVRPDAEGRHPW